MFHRLRLFLLPAIIAGAVVTTSVTPTLAAEAPQFRVYNSGYHTIEALNVSPHGYNHWGADLLGEDYLESGYFDRPLSGYNLPSCYQDVRAVYTNGHVEYMWDVDVCDYNVRFYY
jgi:hypothetical protein